MCFHTGWRSTSPRFGSKFSFWPSVHLAVRPWSFIASSHAALTRVMGVSAPAPCVISVSEVRHRMVSFALVMRQKSCNGHLLTRCSAALARSPGLCSHLNTNILICPHFCGKQNISEFHHDNSGFLSSTSKTLHFQWSRMFLNIGILASVRISCHFHEISASASLACL